MKFFIRLFKNCNKNKENFGEYSMFYENILIKYFYRTLLDSTNFSNNDFKILKDNLINNNISKFFQNLFLLIIENIFKHFFMGNIQEIDLNLESPSTLFTK